MGSCEVESDTTAVGVGDDNERFWITFFRFIIMNYTLCIMHCVFYKINHILCIIIDSVGMREGSLAMASKIRDSYLMSGISKSLADRRPGCRRASPSVEDKDWTNPLGFAVHPKGACFAASPLSGGTYRRW